jgi:hypothetical protein
MARNTGPAYSGISGRHRPESADLRANPLLILPLDSLLGARRISWPYALLLRDGDRDGRRHKRSDDRR